MKKFISLFSILLLAAGLSACNESKPTPPDSAPKADSAQPAKIRIACTEITQSMLEPALPLLTERGVNAELVLMEGNVNVIRAVEDGSTEAALGVHQKFMENFNKQNNGHLAMVKPYPFTTGIGLYSERHKTLEAIPTGAKIGIMNDAMNMNRGLLMLRDAGLIGLNDKKADYTLPDITDNPKKIELIDMDQVQTVRALQDLDASVVFFTHMRNAGKDFRSFIIRDKEANQYPMGIVVNQNHADQPWAKTLAEVLKSEPVKQHITQKFDGVFEYLD